MDGTPRRRPPPWLAVEPPRAVEPPKAGRAHSGSRPAIWQGLYFGAHGAYALASLAPTAAYDTVGMDGGGIGGHLGFNILSGNWLAGLEADATWLDASGARGFAGPARLNAHVDWVTSFRGRIGYVFGDALLYATGGAAAAGLQARFDAPAAASWSNDVPLGYVIGGGIEMRLGADWSGRIEALHFGFDDRSLSFATGRMPADLDVTTVRAGLTFQFR